jgi:uncharacterized protein YigA (DUF484 family)
MSMTEATEPTLRELILADPAVILEDHELMRALLAAERRSQGRNVVDLRGVLVERLEERLDRLEDTHREVIAAAYENVAGTNQIHRACLAILEPTDFAGFLRVLTHDVPMILGVDVIRLGLEAPAAEPGRPLGPPGALQDAVIALPAGGAETYVTGGRGLGARKVTLRTLGGAASAVYGADGGAVRSEAVVMLDLGPGRLAGLLVFGATDPGRFHPDQGTDLLTFFGGVFERALRRWLA